MKKRIFAVACAALLLTACGAKSENASESASDSTFETESSKIITGDVYKRQLWRIISIRAAAL